jgi:hypothetical protein
MEKSLSDFEFCHNENNSSVQPKFFARADSDYLLDTTEGRKSRDPDGKAGIADEVSTEPHTINGNQSLHHQHKEQTTKPSLRHAKEDGENSQFDDLPLTNNLPPNGCERNGHKKKKKNPLPLKDETRQVGIIDENTPKQCRNITKLRYTIPTIITTSVMKENLEDKVGMVFSDTKDRRTVLAKMTPNSLFRDTNLATNHELLTVNGKLCKHLKYFICMHQTELASSHTFALP